LWWYSKHGHLLITLYSLPISLPLPPSQSSPFKFCDLSFLFLFLDFFPFLASTNQIKRGICLCETGLIYLTWCSPVTYIFQKKQHNFILVMKWIKTPSCIFTTFALSIHLLMGTNAGSIVWLLSMVPW
jgi:hypothetical protein